MTALERAARAAAGADAKLSNGPSLYANNPDVYERIARAVLLAVREKPGMNALNAAREVGPDTNSGYFSYGDAYVVFTAMIDAILTQPPTAPRVDPA